jgi:hypothetical protein
MCINGYPALSWNTFLSFPRWRYATVTLEAPINVDRLIGIGGVAIGTGLAIYYGRRSEKSRKPTFVIQQGRDLLINSILFDFPDFSLSHLGSSLPSESVFGMKFRFWNSGNLAILSADILTAFTVNFRPTCKLLDVRLSSVSRSEVGATFSVTNSKITLGVAVLEPNDGLTVQVIYSGSVDAVLDFKGACIGSPAPLVLAPDMVRYGSWWQRSKQFLYTMTTVMVPFVLLQLIIVFVNGPVSRAHPKIAYVVNFCILGLLSLLAVVLLSYAAYRLLMKKNLPSTLIK